MNLAVWHDWQVYGIEIDFAWTRRRPFSDIHCIESVAAKQSLVRRLSDEPEVRLARA
jgi:hypothetical protein